MENIMLYIGPFLGGLVLYVVINALVRAPGANLSSKFAKLGTLQGGTYNEIISAVGAPNSISHNANGKVCQWIQTGYHIVLLFDDNDICLGVSHESAT